MFRRRTAVCAALPVLVTAAVSVAVPASARTAPAAVPPVSSARATAVSSTSVTLSWSVPRSAHVAGTEIRDAEGTRAPDSPRSGYHVVRAIASHRSYTVRHLAAGTRYAFALFTTDGHGHFAARRTVVVTTAPGPASAPHVYEHGSTGVSLVWVNPRTPTFTHVAVRYLTGAVAPATPSSGHGIRVGTRATSAVLSGLTPDTRYSVSVFALDRAGHASTPAIARFTTGAKPGPTTAALSGTVTDRAGDPLAGVFVYAVSLDSERDTDNPVATTGADGSWHLTVAAGDVLIGYDGSTAIGGTSDRTGYQVSEQVLTADAGRSVDAGAVRLDPGAAVSVHVTDATGAPVVGVGVAAVPIQPYVEQGGFGGVFFDGSGPDTTTDEHGDVTLRGLSGRDPLQACVADDSDRYLATCARTPVVPVVGSVVAAPAVVARPAAPVDGGAQLTVRVTGAGHPLSGVGVQVETSIVGEHSAEGSATAGLTGSDGTIRFDGLTAGAYSVCAYATSNTTGSATGYRSTCRSGTVTLTATGSATVSLALPAGAGISGTVTGPTGRPVSGAAVQLATTDSEGDEQIDQIAITDAAGHFRAVGLDPVAGTVCIDAVQTAVSGAPTGLRSTCWNHGARLTPHVGAVRTGIDVTMARGGAISGVVRNSLGLPVLGVIVTADSPSLDSPDELSTGFSDGRGRFGIAGLTPGRYALCLQQTNPDDNTGGFFGFSDSGCQGPATITVTAGATTVTTPRLTDDAALTVTVHDADGAAVAGADVAVLGGCADVDAENCDTVQEFDPHTDVEIVDSRVTHSDGTTTFVGLAPGDYAVCVFGYYATTATGGSPTGYADHCSGSTRTISVPAATTTVVSALLPTGGAVTGTVTDTDGHPLAGVAVHGTDSAATDWPGADSVFVDPGDGVVGPGSDEISDADGSYSIIGVQPGTSTVCADATGVGTAPGYLDRCVGGAPGSDHGTPVTVTAGAVTPGADIVLTPGGGISGTVTAPHADLADDAVEVVVFAHGSPKDGVGTADVDASGRWEVDQVVPGSYTACALDFDANTGQCWKGVAWQPQRQDPPLTKATPIAVTAGAVTPGVGFVLR